MKFLITENQLEKVALLWMNKNFSPDQLEAVTSERYPNSIFYRKNGKVVMEQDKKNKNFWIDYDEFWSFFNSFFSMEYKEWQGVMRTWLEETFNLRGYTPGGIITSTLERWKKLPI
jgi:hypothetical protein